MSKMKRFFMVSVLVLLPALLLGQGTGPTVFTPRLTVSPGPLTVTTDDTTVQDLIILGTCTGCVGTANFANPTGTIGLTAVNGVATTGIRSDGAPALSQAIVPTWSGFHTFTALGTTSLNTYPLKLSNSAVRMGFTETDATLDNGRWDLNASGEALSWRTVDDAGISPVTFWQVQRTGTLVDAINLTANTVTVNGQNVCRADGNGCPSSFSGLANPTATIGLTAVNGSATTALRSDGAPALSQAIAPTWTGAHTFTVNPTTLSNSSPSLNWSETDAALNEKNWLHRASSSGLDMCAATDAAPTSCSVNFFRAARTGTTIDSIALNSTALTWNGNPISTAVGANPTGTIGLTAVNGSATTFLRSDGAPALSQAIAPTWTATHIWSGTGSHWTGTVPQFGLRETGATADEGNWLLRADGDNLLIHTATDAAPTSAAATVMSVARSGTTPSDINFLASTVQLTNSGWLIGNSTAPRLTLNETDAAANNRLWRIGTSSETLVWGTRNDADSAGSDFFSVDRTGTTVDSVTLAATTVAVTGAATVSGTATVSGNIAVNGGITKAACSATVADGTVNNYDIFAACGSTEAIVRLNSAAGTTLTGMVLPANQYVTIVNVGTTNIVFNDEDGGSSSTNQFINIGSLATCTAGTSDMLVLWKDPTTDKVRVFPYVGIVCGA